ncbi:MAG TPA: glycosyltransferase family 2 protein [Flavobacterium sp.]|uniref:glycosyltransferase family 2 protein n=1 Tax=Flavobacterium sp. TaxID=239 RepID=UPI002DBBB1FA|nr:glycosyltransferase family 2 protein [Flavobacterium sp.]HEU4789004.1 glycosyltransferase family 2 protein [Flavobacterium sp.]
MKISVALCTFNGDKFLHKQIDSILQQTLNVDEIIVCDDCSTDHTLKILEEYKKNNPEIFRIYQNEVNLKSNKNFEKAITLCSGDYIFLSDQDDVWRNDKIEKTLAIFNQNSHIEGVFSDATLIDDKGNLVFKNISIWDSFLFYESKMNKPIDLFDFLVANGNFLTGATLCIKKEVKDFCFPFKTSNKFLHDEWFALILAKRRTLYYTTDRLLFYRLHNSQQLGIGDSKKIINPIKKSIREQNLILKLRKVKSFSDYKFMTNRYYAQYERFKDLIEQNPDTPILNHLIDIVIKLYIDFDFEMKKKHPIRHFFRKRKNEKKGRMQIDREYQSARQKD